MLLALLTLAWGFNWPVMKFAVHAYAPLTFRFLCMVGGVISLWAVARWQRQSLHVDRAHWREIVVLAIPNMVIWHLLAIVAVSLLSSGRAAILGYTMPVFATLAAWGIGGERPGLRQWLGVTSALVATLLLLSTEFSAMAGAPHGTLLMLAAAAGWGVGTVMLRRTTLPVHTLVLTFWMLVVATCALGVASLLLEAARWRWPTAGEWGAIAYNAFIAIAFCHVVWFSIARALPPVASGLSVMLIPVLGVFSGAIALGETPHWSDYVAVVLVLVSLATVLNLKRPAPEPQD